MRYGIPLGLMILIGVGALLHPTQARVADPPRRSPIPDGQVQDTADATSVQSVGPVVGLDAQPRPLERPRSTAAASVPSWRKLFVTVDQSLALTEIQRVVVQEMLIDREKEIASWHEAIRKAGLLDLRQYDWQVGLMKESWYRRVDAVLDATQHRRFAVLVSGGLFNDGLAFTVEPGMTVID